MTEISTRVEDLRPAGLALVRELEEAGALTPTSLSLRDPDLPLARYEALAALFGSVKLSCSWWIGDLLNFGEKVYGETYAQAAELFGLTPETLQTYAYVCRSIARSRRRAELTFGHHRLVAPLEPKEQKKWLALAVENRWRRSELKEALSAAGEAPPPPEQPDWTPTPLGASAPAGGATEPLALALPGVAGTATATSGYVSLNGSSISGSVLAELCGRLIEEAIPQGWYVRVPRTTFDELAAFFADE